MKIIPENEKPYEGYEIYEEKDNENNPRKSLKN